MTATLTNRSEGTAAHKGFNPRPELENRCDRGVAHQRGNEADITRRYLPTHDATPHFPLEQQPRSFCTISLYAVRPLLRSVKIASVAGALVASKMGRPLGHVEAGLRSFNRSMPEEINRVVADHLSALLFCPTQTAVDNLTNEGVIHGVHLVGDVMYDVALQSAQAARSRDITERFGVKKGEYLLVTLHRPASVDNRETLDGIVDALVRSGRSVVFPIHPRTRKNLEAFGLWETLRAKVKAIEPVDYLDFIALLMGASKVVTDSGGVQKEAYFFGVPCVTLRDETEWIETVEDGWNALVGTETADILDAIEKFNPSGTKSKSFGDGHAAEKIAAVLDKFV